MIKINLLPKDRKKEQEKKEKTRIVWGIILLLYLATLANFIQARTERQEIKEDILKIKKELQTYKKIEKQKKQIKEKLKETKERIKIIVSLLEKNTKAIKTIDFATKNVPEKEIFLEKIEYVKLKTRNKYTIYIQGNSVNLENIARYMKKLERNNTFKSITLEETKNKKIDDNNFTNFTIKIEL